jgi:hypothetical protein
MNTKIKIGILLDAEVNPVWVNDSISFLKNHPCFEINIVIFRKGAEAKEKPGRFLYRLLRMADRKVFTAKQNLFHRTKAELPEEALKLEAEPVVTKYTDELPAPVLDAIRKCKPDLLLRFGFRILKGEVLSVAKYGVLSLHHGDTDVNRGGPPAFWEVVQKETVTGVTLQVLTKELDGGIVLGKSFIRTDPYSFHRNQSALYAAGIALLADEFTQMSRKGIEVYIKDKQKANPPLTVYTRNLYKDPSNAKTIQIAFTMLFRNVKHQMSSLFYRKQWILLYRYQKTKQPSFHPYRFQSIKVPANRIWADPFPVFANDRYYVFFEEKFWNSDKAHIAALQFSIDGVPVSKDPVIVLNEPHHLSYPFVFNDNGNWYMIPESAAAGEVVLYEAVSFPFKWQKKKTLLQNLRAFDATLLKHNGLWYMFCTVQANDGLSPHAFLHIFYTDDLLSGEWKPHEQNPVYRDVRGARPAGKIFQAGEELIRPAQEGAPVYGYAIRFYRITHLSPELYCEELISKAEPTWNKNLLAVHTFNHCEGLSFFDAQIKIFRVTHK